VAQSKNSSVENRIIRHSTEEIIEAAYRVLLGREPEASGLLLHKEAAENTGYNIEKMLRLFIECDEFKARSIWAPDPGTNHIQDHSQYSEFRILLKLIVNDKTNRGMVVDVGARGRDRSNSYDFMREFGWRGLLIEANPRLIQQIVKDFEGLDFEIVQTAVSDYTGNATFHLGINDDVSSLTKNAASNWGPVQGTVEVPVSHLADILDRYNIAKKFNVLSIDIEGEDVRVLNDLIANSIYRPQFIIIETSMDYHFKSLEGPGFNDNVKDNYSLVGQTPANMILQHVSR
jgi:FkbM family methyltransferase